MDSNNNIKARALDSWLIENGLWVTTGAELDAAIEQFSQEEMEREWENAVANHFETLQPVKPLSPLPLDDSRVITFFTMEEAKEVPQEQWFSPSTLISKTRTVIVCDCVGRCLSDIADQGYDFNAPRCQTQRAISVEIPTYREEFYQGEPYAGFGTSDILSYGLKRVEEFKLYKSQFVQCPHCWMLTHKGRELCDDCEKVIPQDLPIYEQA